MSAEVGGDPGGPWDRARRAATDAPVPSGPEVTPEQALIAGVPEGGTYQSGSGPRRAVPPPPSLMESIKADKRRLSALGAAAGILLVRRLLQRRRAKRNA